MPQDFFDLNEENKETLSDRLLRASANATHALLTIAPLDNAVNAALKIIGEALETDRVSVIENFDCPEQPLPCWKMLYEWDSPGTVSQISHLEVSQGTFEGIESSYESLNQAQTLIYPIEEMPEPFRSGQEKLGVKVLYVVPIFVEGELWGQFGFDDCHEAKKRGQAELSALKIIANSLGCAIQRDRTQKMLLRSEQERSAELAKANDIMLRTVNRLAMEPNLDRFLEFLLYEIASQLGTDTAVITPYDAKSDRLWIAALFADGKTDAIAPMAESLMRPNVVFLERILNAKGFCVFDVEEDADLFWEGSAEYLRTRGKRKAVSFAICLDNQFFGQISLAYETVPNFSPEQTELLQSLSTQAALAIQLTRLAEEAKQTAIAREQEKAARDRAVELESINLELQRALNCLKVIEERFRTLFELSSEGFYFIEVDPPVSTALSVNEQCEQLYQNIQVVEANPAFAAMYGITNPSDCVGMRNTDAHISCSQTNAAFIRSLVENGYYCRNLETEEIDCNGQPRYFLNGGSLIIKDGYIIGGWGSQVDITQLRQTQQALLLTEKQRTAELEKINETLRRSLSWLAREENLNNFLEQILLEISATVQADIAHLFILHQPDRMLEIVARVVDGELIQSPSPSEPAIFSAPFSADITPIFAMMEAQDLLLTLDMLDIQPELQEITWPDNFEWHINAGRKAIGALVLKAGDRTVGFLGLGFNKKQELVGEKRELVIALANQAALAILLMQLAEQSKQAALFEERNRLAGEIHDTLAQSFTGISLQLGVAKWLLKEDPMAIEAILDRINDIAQTGLAEARRSVWEIYPTSKDYSNLKEKLAQMLEKLTGDRSIQVQQQTLGTEYQVPSMIGYNLVKILQEAITNILKHSGATRLSIILIYKESSISLSISDNGRGFQPDLNNGGFGILSMSERSDRIGGQLSINSIVGRGTEILVEVPLQEQKL